MDFFGRITDVHSSAESDRASRQLRRENITGVPYRPGTTTNVFADVLLSGRKNHIDKLHGLGGRRQDRKSVNS